MSAKQRDQVLCGHCGAKWLLKNLETHHKRNHENIPNSKYTVIRADNQPTLSFVGQPPPKIQKQDPPPSPPSSKTEHTSVVEEQSSVDVDDSENQDDVDFNNLSSED